MTDLGTLGGGFSRAELISADGSVIVGSSISSDASFHSFKYVGATMIDLGITGVKGLSGDGSVLVGGNGHAFKYVGTTLTDLGTLGGNFSIANGVSTDGSVIVGQARLANGSFHAFKYVGTAMTDLGTLGGNMSTAGAVSANGAVIIGTSNLANGDFHGFKYTGTTMTDLGTLGGNETTVNAVSATGSVIVGYSLLANGNYGAFKYAGGKMTNLGSFGGSYMYAYGVSADGSTIIGYGELPDGRQSVFKYVGTTLTNLGTLGGSLSQTSPGLVSAHGGVIAGVSSLANGDTHAFKYTGTTMTDLGTLGGTDSYATGVSEDGSTIIGASTLANGDTHAFLYTEAGMLDVVQWVASLRGPSSVFPFVSSLASLPMEVAHNRPLMSFNSMGKNSQSWITGDFGTRLRTSDSRTASGEAGVSSTFGNLVAGVAVGYGEQNNDLLFGGSSRIFGEYILGEVDTRLPDNESILSLTSMFGSWKSDTQRGYGVGGGGADFSDGSTNLNSASVRLRLDGPSQKIFQGPSIAPFASFTLSRTSADAYDETGGSYDAHFNDQTHISRESRLGLTAKFDLAATTSLLATAEWIHRFDKTESNFSGTDIDHGSLPFNVAGADITANQARFGFDIDHKLAAETMLNFSAHFAGVGPVADTSCAVSIRRAF